MTCWRLRDWNNAGVWDQLHRLLLAELRHAELLDWSRAVIDASHVRASKGEATGASPVDRARPGGKHHLLCDAAGIPLAVSLTASNAHDVTQLLPLVGAIPAVAGTRGRPRQRATPRWRATSTWAWPAATSAPALLRTPSKA
jgi:hypothetical protein